MRKQMKRKEGLINKIIEGIKKFSRRKLVRNKLISLALFIIGYLSIMIFEGIGIFLLYAAMAIMIFFMRVDFIEWFMNEEV